jgi:hypothetical protein
VGRPDQKTPRTPSEQAALQAFKEVVTQGDQAGYPDHVTIISMSQADADFRPVFEAIESGKPIIVVSDDGGQIMLRLRPRRGLLGLLDRVRRRRAVAATTRRGEWATERVQTVHSTQQRELRDLRELVAG